MNKKIGAIVFLLLLSFSIVIAQSDGIPFEDEVGQIEDIVDKGEDFQESDDKREYLKQEWTSILEKSGSGRILLGISKILNAFSPAFKFFLAIEYSLSWIFFITLFFWLATFFIIFDAGNNMFEGKGWVSAGIAAIIPTIAAHAGVFSSVIDFFSVLFTSKWPIIITIIIAIILLVLYHKLMKNLKIKFKKETEIRREQKAKTTEKIHDITIKGSGG